MVGTDWVVRYDNRALQILSTARPKRFTGPKARILVRESVTGELRLVARAAAPVRPPSALRRLAPPAGYTRAGKPLSANQMAVRERWNQEVRDHIRRYAPRASDQVTPA